MGGLTQLFCQQGTNRRESKSIQPHVSSHHSSHVQHLQDGCEHLHKQLAGLLTTGSQTDQTISGATDKLEQAQKLFCALVDVYNSRELDDAETTLLDVSKQVLHSRCDLHLY